jgi:hypothetical protein
MGDSAKKANEALKAANDAKSAADAVPKGDHAERRKKARDLVEKAAEALRGFVELGDEKGVDVPAKIKEANGLLKGALGGVPDKLGSFASYSTEHLKKGIDAEDAARASANAGKNDKATEQYTRAGAEFHITATAQVKMAEEAVDDAATKEQEDQKHPTLATADAKLQAHMAAGDAFKEAAGYFERAAQAYEKAADLENVAQPHELAERKRGLEVAALLYKEAAEQCTKVGDEYLKGGEPSASSQKLKDNKAAKDGFEGKKGALETKAAAIKVP